MIRFAIASLIPVPLLIAASLLGGGWSWAVFLWLTVLVALLDRVLPPNWRNADPTEDFDPGEVLSLALGLIHLGLVVLLLWSLPRHHGWELWAMATAYGVWFGQVSHPNAHELIHRPGRGLRRLGRLVYASLLFGQHASAHPKVHHIWVATPEDPNSARPGEGLWRYLGRAWTGSFVKGYRAEKRDLARAGRPAWRTPYVEYMAVALVVCLLSLALGGLRGLVIWLLVCAFAQMQILQADYVQHYGLQRQKRPDGKYEPAGMQHSWNAPQAASAAMMLNAPRHSDHHLHPGRLYPALQLDAATMPVLPRSLPVMAALALSPRLWRRVMDPRVAEWQARVEQAAPIEPGTTG